MSKNRILGSEKRRFDFELTDSSARVAAQRYSWVRTTCGSGNFVQQRPDGRCVFFEIMVESPENKRTCRSVWLNQSKPKTPICPKYFLCCVRGRHALSCLRSFPRSETEENETKTELAAVIGVVTNFLPKQLLQSQFTCPSVISRLLHLVRTAVRRSLLSQRRP